VYVSVLYTSQAMKVTMGTTRTKERNSHPARERSQRHNVSQRGHTTFLTTKPTISSNALSGSDKGFRHIRLVNLMAHLWSERRRTGPGAAKIAFTKESFVRNRSN